MSERLTFVADDPHPPTPRQPAVSAVCWLCDRPVDDPQHRRPWRPILPELVPTGARFVIREVLDSDLQHEAPAPLFPRPQRCPVSLSETMARKLVPILDEHLDDPEMWALHVLLSSFLLELAPDPLERAT